MRTVRLLIEYDGTEYSGWQVQSNGPSIEEELEGAIHKVTGERVRVAGSGRTDAGVHALGQVATFRTESDIAGERFAPALNSHLPAAICVLRSDWVSNTFHARKTARGKVYRYRILNRTVRPALLRGRAYHFAPPLDVETMGRAAAHFVGERDFRALTPPSSVRPAGYVRTIRSLEVTRRGDEVLIEVCGNGFLHNMVRIIAGTLIQVGRGKLAADAVPGILESRDRTRAGPTAPACGLYMVSVEYGENQPSA